MTGADDGPRAGADPGAREDAPRPGRLYRLVVAVVFGLMGLLRWRVEVEGFEHVPLRGGTVLIANHLSYVDFFTVGRAPYERLARPIRLLGKASLFRTPVLGTIMRAAEHIPVERGAGSHAFDAAVAALHRGELIGVLPEQTISESLELLPFKTGAVRMAQLAGAPLVPAVSWGTQRALPVYGPYRPAWRLPVLVAYGPARVVPPDADPAAVTAALRDEMAAMLDRLQHRYPDGLPSGARWVPARLGGGAPTMAEAAAQLAALEERWRERLDRRRRRGSDARRDDGTTP
ncbi:MAG: lysophospholipid acyltransferase family protein [Nitriliruptoraceae bacterium]